MKKCVESLNTRLNRLSTGRVSPSLIDGILVEYYGILTPLNQIANIVVEDSRTLVVTVFDRKIAVSVEKAIAASNRGFNPSSFGTIIHVKIPPLTEDRRRTLIKIVRDEAENGKISVRNVRRDANNKIKSLLKEKKINQDEDRYAQNDIRQLTIVWIKKIDSVLENKETELIQF